MKKTLELNACNPNFEKSSVFYEAMPFVVRRLLESSNCGKGFDHVDTITVPSQELIIELIKKTRCIIFPGYFSQTVLTPSNFEFWLNKETKGLFEGLSQQILVAIQHDCLRYDQPCEGCTELSHQTALRFIQTLPKLRSILATDVQAAWEGDPAAKSYEEIIFSYPGLFAITVHRMAHELHRLRVPLLPRMISEYAHSLTGIDIHPGADIGESFFIDHGTGVVVGETTEIGNRARLYQGVTLGALSLPKDKTDSYRDKKRHPTIEDDVIVYSNTTILGGQTVIGARSTIGGNIWITESVPPDTKVLLKRPELIYTGNKNNRLNLPGHGRKGR
ncbi:MAG: serine acetyltransferase [Desulfobacterales bacterium]|jgi:serine O-acetyltransferase